MFTLLSPVVSSLVVSIQTVQQSGIRSSTRRQGWNVRGYWCVWSSHRGRLQQRRNNEKTGTIRDKCKRVRLNIENIVRLLTFLILERNQDISRQWLIQTKVEQDQDQEKMGCTSLCLAFTLQLMWELKRDLYLCIVQSRFRSRSHVSSVWLNRHPEPFLLKCKNKIYWGFGLDMHCPRVSKANFGNLSSQTSLFTSYIVEMMTIQIYRFEVVWLPQLCNYNYSIKTMITLHSRHLCLRLWLSFWVYN